MYGLLSVVMILLDRLRLVTGFSSRVRFFSFIKQERLLQSASISNVLSVVGIDTESVLESCLFASVV